MRKKKTARTKDTNIRNGKKRKKEEAQHTHSKH